jgi:hypothetical protein
MKPTLDKVKADLAFLNLMPETLIEVFKVVKTAFSDGFDAGTNEQLEELEIPESDEERIGVNYAIGAFSEIQSYSEFKVKMDEITKRSYNFIKPTGQTLFTK